MHVVPTERGHGLRVYSAIFSPMMLMRVKGAGARVWKPPLVPLNILPFTVI